MRGRWAHVVAAGDALITVVAASLIGLLIVTIPLVALARRVNISYPIVLVLGGLVLGFVPGLPPLRLDPDIVLLIFLPPLLYWESITAPTDVMFENVGQIGLLAVGLVIATTVAVAAVAHVLIPGMSWPVAFVLGAIVSPTDELAAVPVLEHFRLPRHLIAIIDGESLLNDATALVLYATAIAAVSTGTFAMSKTLLGFVVAVAGSLAIGYATARGGVELWRRVRDPELQSVVSVALPFVAYLPAQQLNLSGVLAVVTAGVYVNRHNPRVLTAAARTQLIGFWNTFVFLANVLLFLVVGLELHTIASAAFSRYSWSSVLGYALAVNAVIVAVRISLALAAEYAPTTAPADHAAPNWRNAFIVAWSGLRGAVSLAAALAIPIALPSGTPFPDRDLIIFLTFSVIAVTLVGGGLSLPSVVRRLNLARDSAEDDEVRLAQLRSAEAAIRRIDELASDGRIDAPHAERLRAEYEHRIELKAADPGSAAEAHAARHLDVQREVIEAQRQALLALRENGEIDNVVFRRVQADLDLLANRGELQRDR